MTNKVREGMSEKYLIIYQDLPYDKVKKHEVMLLLKANDTMLIKPCDIPGMYGYPKVYIRHYKVEVNGKEFLIIAYTQIEQNHDFRNMLIAKSAKLMIKEKIVSKEELKDYY